MPSDFSVVAIIASYNEADIIGSVVRDLIDQGISICFLDDGSTDGTVEAVEPYAGRGVIQIERLGGARDAGPTHFTWEQILRRKAQLATELDADWFIHHDADEFRESPWADVPLKDGIRRVDALGYNAIDFASLDFRPTHDRFRSGDDVRAEFPFYSEGAAYDKVQIRCWKKTEHVDLASSGGHEAQFDGRNVFPIRFISRHYPVRGQAHGERKVFVERRPRFSDGERARGWHVQYDGFVKGTSFIHDPCTLTRYDPADVRIGLSRHHRGVEALEASLDTVRASLEARTRDVERLRLGLEQREAELHDVRAQLAARTSEVANFKDALIDHRRRLDAFERSLSWRWTAPARAIYRLLGGS